MMLRICSRTLPRVAPRRHARLSNLAREDPNLDSVAAEFNSEMESVFGAAAASSDLDDNRSMPSARGLRGAAELNRGLLDAQLQLQSHKLTASSEVTPPAHMTSASHATTDASESGGMHVHVHFDSRMLAAARSSGGLHLHLHIGTSSISNSGSSGSIQQNLTSDEPLRHPHEVKSMR